MGKPNLILDPFETQNRAYALSSEEQSYLHDTLEHLKACKGRSCTIRRNGAQMMEHTSNQGHKMDQKMDALGECLLNIRNYIFKLIFINDS